MRDSSIPFMRRGPDTVNIVKLYGDLDQPDTIVLARQQYESYFLQRPQMVKLLETELARSDTLYLGWSGSDPYFKLVFGELLSRFGEMMRPGYAVMFDVTDAQRDELARKQIRLVELPAGDRTAQLARWLEGLASSNTSPIASVAFVTGNNADLPSKVADKPRFPLRFIIKGDWQTVRALVMPPIVGFTSAQVERLELSYTGLATVASGNDADWVQGVLATMVFKGRHREGRVGQITAHMLGESERLVTLALDDIFGEVLIPVFWQVLKNAVAQGLVVEILDVSQDESVRRHMPSAQPPDANCKAAPSYASAPPAPGEQSHAAASGEHSVTIGGNVSNNAIIIGDGNVVGDNSSSNFVKGQASRQSKARPGQAGPKWNTAAFAIY